MPDVFRIGTRIFSWESQVLTFDGQPFEGLSSLDLEQKRERKVYWGMRRDGTPLGKTAGKYSVSGVTFKMLADSYDMLTDYLSAKGVGSYGDAEFTMSLMGVEVSPLAAGGQIPLKPLGIVLGNCTIDGEKDSYVEGTDEAAVEVSIGALWVRRNGKQLWSLQASI